MSRTRVSLISLGCAKNLVDAEVMLGRLDAAGCELVADPDAADVVVVNTCAFIESAREESVQAILEAAERKRTGRARKVVVAGCLVQRYGDELRRELPEIDAFVDLDQVPRIAEISGLAPTPLASDLPLVPRRATWLYDDTDPRVRATPPWTAYVKIAEGCDHTCAFCAIPTFRGSFRSRDPESLVREATALARAGVREINLVAQDSSHYGRDLGRTIGLAELLERLDAVPDLRWIRVHYLYPNTLTDRVLEAMARLPRVVPYVDLPLQHAHGDTLARMRRGGSAESHLRLLDRVRSAMPEASLRTTLLVGFPGETETEFETLLAFLDEARFDHVGVFSYSHEEHTPGERLADDVPPAVKEERRTLVLAHQQPIAFARNGDRVGTRAEVLVEGVHAETEHLLVGRTRGQAREVDGQVLLNDGYAEAGSFVQVEITDAAGYDLVGAILGPV
jgi:ribosomal protein S12 methylthiotransferase